MPYTTPSTTTSSDLISSPVPLLKRKGTILFIKFCIVGLSSTIVNFGFTDFFKFVIHDGLVPSLIIGFLLSLVNGFIWNRKWTFREFRDSSATTQSLRFFVVGVVGLLMNTTIAVLIVTAYESHKANSAAHAGFTTILMAVVAGTGKQQLGWLAVNGALAVATGVVVFWNFFANRMWTFKKHKTN